MVVQMPENDAKCYHHNLDVNNCTTCALAELLRCAKFRVSATGSGDACIGADNCARFESTPISVNNDERELERKIGGVWDVN